MTAFRRAAGSSLIVRSVRRLVMGLRTMDQRIAAGLGDPWSAAQEAHETESVRRLLSTSRIAALLSALMTALTAASREAYVARWLGPLHGLDLPSRIRTGGVAIIVAVVSHTILMAVIGVPVHSLGWTMRAVLVAGGAIALRWPEPFAAAWKDRQTRSR